jgi:hypothetical protein
VVLRRAAVASIPGPRLWWAAHRHETRRLQRSLWQRSGKEDPKAKVPGTKMIYAGLKDEQKVNDLLAFLKQFDADGKKK